LALFPLVLVANRALRVADIGQIRGHHEATGRAKARRDPGHFVRQQTAYRRPQ